VVKTLEEAAIPHERDAILVYNAVWQLQTLVSKKNPAEQLLVTHTQIPLLQVLVAVAGPQV
jgi:hypothetical protein